MMYREEEIREIIAHAEYCLPKREELTFAATGTVE